MDDTGLPLGDLVTKPPLALLLPLLVGFALPRAALAACPDGWICLAPNAGHADQTSGIQTAINGCPTFGPCPILLRPGTYSITKNVCAFAADRGAIEIDGKFGVTLAGAGAGLTRIVWQVPARCPIAPNEPTLLFIFSSDPDGFAHGTTVQDLSLELEIACEPLYGVTTCSTGEDMATVRIGEARFTRLLRVGVAALQRAGDYTGSLAPEPRAIYATGNLWRGTGVTADVFTFGVWVVDSFVVTSDHGIEFVNCDDCWVTGTTIFSGPSRNTSSGVRYREAVGPAFKKYVGDGVRFQNNTVDLTYWKSGLEGAAVLLKAQVIGPTAGHVGENAQITHNSFININADGEPAGFANNLCKAVNDPMDCCSGAGTGFCIGPASVVRIEGYGHADISGNLFAPRRGALTTNRTVAIRLYGLDTCIGESCGAYNRITDNNFRRWRGDLSFPSQNYCPISWAPRPQLRGNVVSGNVFDLRDKNTGLPRYPTTPDAVPGFCGDLATHLQNFIGQNHSPGGAQSLLEVPLLPGPTPISEGPDPLPTLAESR